MNLLVTGRGTSGSWKIRGEQLGSAIGAAVIPEALDVAGYMLAVVVKRPGASLPRLQSAGVPIVWDVVDAWPQPVGNEWGRAECLAWLRNEVNRIKPIGLVCATQRMAEDCEFGLPLLALPHHSRPGLAINPVRSVVRKVGYEGGQQYITRWAGFLQGECQRRGWQFVVNPNSLAELDIVVAVRDQSGYAPRKWKSNVKLANAQGSGTPVVLCDESGYRETASGGEVWANTPQEMVAAFDLLTSHDERLKRSEQLRKAAISLDSVASTYAVWLRSLIR